MINEIKKNLDELSGNIEEWGKFHESELEEKDRIIGELEEEVKNKEKEIEILEDEIYNYKKEIQLLEEKIIDLQQNY